jgi:hypothetical protein
LDETEPDGAKKLVSPNLIKEINNPFGNIVNYLVVYLLFLINQLFIIALRSVIDTSKPNKVDHIHYYDRIELLNEKDVSVVKEEADWHIFARVT